MGHYNSARQHLNIKIHVSTPHNYEGDYGGYGRDFKDSMQSSRDTDETSFTYPLLTFMNAAHYNKSFLDIGIDRSWI